MPARETITSSSVSGSIPLLPKENSTLAPISLDGREDEDIASCDSPASRNCQLLDSRTGPE